MKNIQKIVKNAILAKNIRKSISSTSLGCVAIAGILGFTTLVPAYTVMAETAYTEKVVFDITAKVPSYTSIDDIKLKATKISPEANPDLFLKSPYSGTDIVKVQSLPLDGKVRYYESKNPSVDGFNIEGYVIIKITEVLEGSQLKGYKLLVGMVGDDTVVSDVYLDPSKTYNLNEFYVGDLNNSVDIIKSNLDKISTPTPEPKPDPIPTPDPKPEPKPDPIPVPTPDPEQPKDEVDPVSVRLGGANRYETAIKIAKESLKGKKMKGVILASGYDFPDSLSASGLSSKYDAPILLVENTAVASKLALDFVYSNLEKDGQVVIVGGEGVIDKSVEASLKQHGITKIKRLGGKDRHETNKLIVKDLNPSKGGVVFLASSYSYADALSVSPISASNKNAIVLSEKEIGAGTKTLINGLAPKTIYIIGGTGVISSSTEKYLKSKYNVVRLGGSDRYETCKLVYNRFKTSSMNSVLLASSVTFPDSLTGAYLGYKNNSMVLLVRPDDYKIYKSSVGKNVKRFYALGGTSVVPKYVVDYYLK